MKKAMRILYSLIFVAVIVWGGVTILRQSGGAVWQAVRAFAWSAPGETTAAVNDAVEGALITAARDRVVDTYGLIQRAFARVEIRGVLRDRDGLLHAVDEAPDADKAERDAQNLRALHQYAEGLGAAFLFVQAPSDVLPGQTRLPLGARDGTNARIDWFLERAGALGVPTLDARGLFAGRPARDVFYATDHHWTTGAMFDTMGAILGDLDTRCGLQLDPDGIVADRDSYRREVVPGFLGSHGVRVGRFFAGEDDLVLLEPSFPVQAEMTFRRDGAITLQTSGGFREAFIQEDYLRPGYKNKYNAFLHARTDECVIENRLRPDGLRCLVIADSFGRSLAPYLSACFATTALLDPQEGRYREDYLAYMDAYQPDVVVVLFNGRSVFTQVPAVGAV